MGPEPLFEDESSDPEAWNLIDLSKEEMEDPVHIARSRILSTAYDFEEWLSQRGFAPTYWIFVRLFEYQSSDRKEMYEAIMRVREAAVMR